MLERKDALHDVGRLVYGLSGIALGILGLVWRDFAAVWQPLENLGAGGARRATIACVFAGAFLLAGAATLWRRTAAMGFLGLASLHLISTLGWIPRVMGNPRIYGVWNGISEQLSLVAAGVVGFATLASLPYETKARTIQIGTIVFGICVVSFAFGHFTAIPETAGFVPKWVPGGQMFWAWATGVFHLLAGLAILSGVQAVLASRLLVVMMLGFGAFVWVPMLLAKSSEHFRWAGTAITLALAAAAWVVSDSIAARRKRAGS